MRYLSKYNSRNGFAQILPYIHFFLFEESFFFFYWQFVQLIKRNITPLKRCRNRHHKHHFTNTKNPIIHRMNSILTCHNIITSMNAWCNFIPTLTCIFVPILLSIINYNPILYGMGYLGYVSIVKSRLPLFYIGNPCFHSWRIFSKIVINIIFRNLSHSP